jgi:pantothenate kinase
VEDERGSQRERVDMPVAHSYYTAYETIETGLNQDLVAAKFGY